MEFAEVVKSARQKPGVENAGVNYQHDVTGVDNEGVDVISTKWEGWTMREWKCENNLARITNSGVKKKAPYLWLSE